MFKDYTFADIVLLATALVLFLLSCLAVYLVFSKATSFTFFDDLSSTDQLTWVFMAAPIISLIALVGIFKRERWALYLMLIPFIIVALFALAFGPYLIVGDL